jgi:hypothetical protein
MDAAAARDAAVRCAFVRSPDVPGASATVGAVDSEPSTRAAKRFERGRDGASTSPRAVLKELIQRLEEDAEWRTSTPSNSYQSLLV